jgi:hypothetical protein
MNLFMYEMHDFICTPAWMGFKWQIRFYFFINKTTTGDGQVRTQSVSAGEQGATDTCSQVVTAHKYSSDKSRRFICVTSNDMPVTIEKE